MTKIDDSTIKEGEFHPAASSAMEYIKVWMMGDLTRWLMMREAVASTALSGNRLAQICNGTLNRLERGDPVSDRYLLGLAWFLKEHYDKAETANKK